LKVTVKRPYDHGIYKMLEASMRQRREFIHPIAPEAPTNVMVGFVSETDRRYNPDKARPGRSLF